MALPANVRYATSVPFPALVTGTGPITINKINGVWTVGFAPAPLSTPLVFNGPNGTVYSRFDLNFGALCTGVVVNEDVQSSLVRGTGFTETIEIVPFEFPGNTMISWSWPTMANQFDFGVRSYPFIGLLISSSPSFPLITALNSCVTTFDYKLDGESTNDVLYDIWLNDPSRANQTVEVEVFLKLHGNLQQRYDPYPVISVQTAAPRNDCYDTQIFYDTAVVTGSISGTVLTVTAVTHGSITGFPVPLYGASVAAGTNVTSQSSGSAGGAGTYVVSVSQTVGSETMTMGNKHVLTYPVSKILNAANDSKGNSATLSGSIAGTPGTDPTNCSFIAAGIAGLTKSIIGSGTVTAADGQTVNYVDVRWQGTPGSSGNIQFEFEKPGTTSSVSPFYQRWFFQAYLALVAGSLTNLGIITLNISGYSDVNYNNFNESYSNNPPLNSYLTSTAQKFALQAKMGSSTTAYMLPQVLVAVTSGQAIDFTLRLASPCYIRDFEISFFQINSFVPNGYQYSLTVTSGSRDWLAMFRAMNTAGVLNSAEQLTTIQFGSEVISGVGSMHFTKYSALIF